jgi:anti-anti-sigma regulatory factor
VRVTIYNPDGQGVVMKIEGELAGLQVPELERAWQELAPSLGERHLLVDVRGLTHLDASGQKLLAEIYFKSNAEFIADTPLTKYFAEQAIRFSNDMQAN